MRSSPPDVLDPATSADEPAIYWHLSRCWRGQETIRDLDEALHRIEQERAARPPAPGLTAVARPDDTPTQEIPAARETAAVAEVRAR